MGNSLTYPVPAPTGTEDLTAEQVQALLKNQDALAWRIRDLASQRFIADALLTEKYKVVNGVVLYESGEPVMIQDPPEIVVPGGEYPRSQADDGPVAGAKTDKWGRDIPVTDESIKRRGISSVNRKMNQLINRMVATVDGAALGVISSKVTQTYAATGGWNSASDIVQSIQLAKAKIRKLGEGYVLDTIVLEPEMYEKAMVLLTEGGYLPREAGNPINSGEWPQVLNLRWLESPHVPSNVPLLVDTDNLGGMADEKLGSPGYSTAQSGIEVKSIRVDANDRWDLRARRVTIPVVVDPKAAIQITGVSL